MFALLTDDGPYSKGSKDSGGMDAALVSRRQSIPGKGDQLLLQNIGASIALYLDTPNMGKIPQNTNFGASISKAFAGGQKWMVVTGLSGGVLLVQSLSRVELLTVVTGSWERTYSCTGLTLTKKKQQQRREGRNAAIAELIKQGGRLAVSGKLRISHI